MIARGTREEDPDALARPSVGADTEVPERAQPRRYSAAYKARVPSRFEGLRKAEKGALLRREGLLLADQRVAQAARSGRARRAGPESGTAGR